MLILDFRNSADGILADDKFPSMQMVKRASPGHGKSPVKWGFWFGGEVKANQFSCI